MEGFLENPLWNFIGFLVGLAGVAFSFLFYFRGRKTKRLDYRVRMYTIFSERVSSLNGLKISLNGVLVEKLFDYRILIWNCGNGVLHLSDFAASRPPKVVIPKGSECVIGCNLLGASSKTNSPVLEWDTDHPEAILLNFEYLAPKEGMVISVLCNKELVSPPGVDGLIKGSGDIKDFHPIPLSRKVYKIYLPLTMMFVGISFFIRALKVGDVSLYYAILSVVFMLGALGLQIGYERWSYWAPRQEATVAEMFDMGFHEIPDR